MIQNLKSEFRFFRLDCPFKKEIMQSPQHSDFSDWIKFYSKKRVSQKVSPPKKKINRHFNQKTTQQLEMTAVGLEPTPLSHRLIGHTVSRRAKLMGLAGRGRIPWVSTVSIVVCWRSALARNGVVDGWYLAKPGVRWFGPKLISRSAAAPPAAYRAATSSHSSIRSSVSRTTSSHSSVRSSVSCTANIPTPAASATPRS